jgi:hypothetical protein
LETAVSKSVSLGHESSQDLSESSARLVAALARDSPSQANMAIRN